MKDYYITNSDGSKEWFRDAIYKQRHRSDGPAVEDADGTKEWWVDGMLHRLDGPAVEFAGGRKEYWLNGKHCSYDEWERLRKLQAFV